MEDQLGSIGLAHSQDTLRFSTMPNINLRVAPKDRHGLLLHPLINHKTTLHDLNRACIGIECSDWQTGSTVCGKLTEKKYRTVKEVADDRKRLQERKRAKAQ